MLVNNTSFIFGKSKGNQYLSIACSSGRTAKEKKKEKGMEKRQSLTYVSSQITRRGTISLDPNEESSPITSQAHLLQRAYHG